MPQPLISLAAKTPLPAAPINYEGNTPVVSGSASVPIELRIVGAALPGPVGVDIVFIIDNSGTMGPDWPHSDPDKKRFSAVSNLCDAFAPTRDSLDRIAMVRCQGEEAIVVDEEAPWKTWSATKARIQGLMVSPEPSGRTPIRDAMQKADALLMGLNGFYRLAILISDGLPVPDDVQNPQTTTIMVVVIPCECIPNRILYSTIYLYTQPPADNALLAYIAGETDYITSYLPGDPPAYYFRITSPDEIEARYRALFDTLRTRLVPQDVRLSERVNGRLIIDPDAPVSFSGSGFLEVQNLLGGVPLSDLMEQFRSTRQLAVHLNELDGEVVLRFSVKLDLASVSDAEYAARAVYLDVDVLPDSSITYLQPNATAGSTSVTLAMPQARIKFILGLAVAKELDANGTTVRIWVSNIDPQPVKEFQLAAFPSSYANVRRVVDDFAFGPFRMLYERRILPWFLQHVPVQGLSDQARRTLLAKAKAALLESHKPVLDLSSRLDRYLGQFGFIEQKPGNQIYDAFWNTESQRGIYRLVPELGAHATRCVTFDLEGASYLLADGLAQVLATPADALESKGVNAMSEFTAQGMGDWKRVTQNPPIYQTVFADRKADLYLRTCLSSEHVRRLKALFMGESPLDPWVMLDSIDIKLVWQLSDPSARIGLSLMLSNAGDVPSASTRLLAKSVFLPFTGEEAAQPNLPGQYQAAPPFFGQADVKVPPVLARWKRPVEVAFTSLKFLNPQEEVRPDFLRKVRDAIVVSTVDILPASNERVLSNNSAIEIVPLHGT